MAASLSIRVQTGTAPGSRSQVQAGGDLISADNSGNSYANRLAHPIAVPTGADSAYSYEKWIMLVVDAPPANAVTNFRAWIDAPSNPVQPGVSIFGKGSVASYTTPVATASPGTSLLPTVQTDAIVWDSSSYSSVSEATKYLVIQLAVVSVADPGPVTQVTLSYAYDET